MRARCCCAATRPNAKARIAEFSPRDAERLPAYDAALERAADVLRDLVLRTPPNAGGGILELIGRRANRAPRARAGARRQAAAARSLHQERRRFSRRLVRERGGERRVRLRLHRRHLRRALDAGHRLRAAASLLRRGERQARGLGTCDRRHGRHQRRRLRRPPCAWRRDPHRTRVSRSCSMRDGKVSGVVLDSGEEIAARAVAANVPPKLLFRDLVPEGAVAPELRASSSACKSGSGTFRMNVALAELPDFTCRPGKQAQDHHGAGHRHRADARLPGAGLSRRAQRRLVARAGRGDADPLDARCNARTQRQARREPVRAARRAASARWPQLGRRARERSLRRSRHRHGQQARAQLQGCGHRAAGALAARSGTPLRHGRRRYLPRGVVARPALLGAAASRLCQLPHAGCRAFICAGRARIRAAA